jgi:hypothetical protein
MFMEVNTVEAPDLSVLNGGCSLGEDVADDGGSMPVDECGPDSAPYRGVVQELGSVEETEERIPFEQLE